MMTKDAMQDADRHMAEWDEYIHEYDIPRKRMSNGEVFTAAIIIGSAAYFAVHALRFFIPFFLKQN